MKIELANVEDTDYIAESLSSFFEETNTHFGFEKYKTDYSIMHKVVSERISNQESEFKYFVAKKDDVSVGFVNILLSKKTPEILILSGISLEVEEALLNLAIEEFKTIGVNTIHGEVGLWNKTKKLLDKYDTEGVQVNYKLKV